MQGAIQPVQKYQGGIAEIDEAMANLGPCAAFPLSLLCFHPRVLNPTAGGENVSEELIRCGKWCSRPLHSGCISSPQCILTAGSGVWHSYAGYAEVDYQQ